MSTFQKTMSLMAYLHTITKDVIDDYYLRVKLEKQTLTTDDIAVEVAAQQGKYEAREIAMLLNNAMEVVAEAVASGYQVNLPLCRIQPGVSGIVMKNDLSKPIDRTKVKVYANLSQGTALKKAMSTNQMELFQQPAVVGPFVNGAINPTMPSAGYLLQGQPCVISGRNLKLVGDDATIGITFTNTADQTEVKIAPASVFPNEPTSLQFVVPASLTDGTWNLTVTTQYSGGGVMVKTPRSYTFETPIQVGEGSGGGEGGGDDVLD